MIIKNALDVPLLLNDDVTINPSDEYSYEESEFDYIVLECSYGSVNVYINLNATDGIDFNCVGTNLMLYHEFLRTPKNTRRVEIYRCVRFGD